MTEPPTQLEQIRACVKHYTLTVPKKASTWRCLLHALWELCVSLADLFLVGALLGFPFLPQAAAHHTVAHRPVADTLALQLGLAVLTQLAVAASPLSEVAAHLFALFFGSEAVAELLERLERLEVELVLGLLVRII